MTNTMTYTAPAWDDYATFTVKATDANGCISTCSFRLAPKLRPPGGTPKTQTITLKSNGYMEADFIVP